MMGLILPLVGLLLTFSVPFLLAVAYHLGHGKICWGRLPSSAKKNIPSLMTIDSTKVDGTDVHLRIDC